MKFIVSVREIASDIAFFLSLLIKNLQSVRADWSLPSDARASLASVNTDFLDSNLCSARQSRVCVDETQAGQFSKKKSIRRVNEL